MVRVVVLLYARAIGRATAARIALFDCIPPGFLTPSTPSAL